MGRKQSTVTSFASLALNGVLQGMLMNNSDKDLFEKSTKDSLSSLNEDISNSVSDENVSILNIIDENDNGDATINGQESDTSENGFNCRYAKDTERVHMITDNRGRHVINRNPKERRPLLRQWNLEPHNEDNEEQTSDNSDNDDSNDEINHR